MNRITATYFIETPLDPYEAAGILAGEQSSGTFVSVPGETETLKNQFAARVEEVIAMDVVDLPSLAGASCSKGPYNRAMVKVSWSLDNFGFNLPELISTVQGNLYELRQFTGLRLVDLDFPNAYVSNYRGPAHGVEGCRKMTGVQGRPLIGTIIKPSVGLRPDQTANLVAQLATAGIDFIKDDELLGSSANSPFELRLQKVMDVINCHFQETGKKIMYAANISGEMDEMLSRYEMIVNLGGTCAMINVNSVGIAATKKICDNGALAIHAHRNGWGMLTRHPLLGMDFRAYQKIWRLVGADQLHVNGIQNKFWESDDSVVASINALQLSLGKQQHPLPVVSSGQWGGQAFETWRRTATTDLLYMAGGGILAHPMGPQAGVKSLQQAWDAAVEGLTIEEAIAEFPEFAASAQKFSTK
jgi:ribulose-bisphosphate carboxylase large chain